MQNHHNNDTVDSTDGRNEFKPDFTTLLRQSPVTTTGGRKTGKRKCEVCRSEITFYSWDRHIQSNIHKIKEWRARPRDEEKLIVPDGDIYCVSCNKNVKSYFWTRHTNGKEHILAAIAMEELVLQAEKTANTNDPSRRDDALVESVISAKRVCPNCRCVVSTRFAESHRSSVFCQRFGEILTAKESIASLTAIVSNQQKAIDELRLAIEDKSRFVKMHLP